jgi:hypothetical protein
MLRVPGVHVDRNAADPQCDGVRRNRRAALEDVLVRDGRIAARGAGLYASDETRLIDAGQQWLMPGLLDIHTHLDLEVELAPGLPESVRHGTTTVVVGNCSLGTAFGAQRATGDDPVLDCFARVENVPKSVLSRVVDRMDWNTTAGYLAHLDALPLGPNIVPLLPHSMLRIAVMGTAAAVPRDTRRGRRTKRCSERCSRAGGAGFRPTPSLSLLMNRHTDKPSPQHAPGELGALDRAGTIASGSTLTLRRVATSRGSDEAPAVRSASTSRR